jgi:hypothetical protein
MGRQPRVRGRRRRIESCHAEILRARRHPRSGYPQANFRGRHRPVSSAATRRQNRCFVTGRGGLGSRPPVGYPVLARASRGDAPSCPSSTTRIRHRPRSCASSPDTAHALRVVQLPIAPDPILSVVSTDV